MKAIPIGVVYVAGAGVAIALAWRAYSDVKELGSTAGEAVVDTVKEGLEAVNPVNPENIVAKTVNKGVQMITGNKDDTLGTWWYSLINPKEAAGEEITRPVPIVTPPPAAPATSSQGAAAGAGPAPTIPGPIGGISGIQWTT